MKIQYDAQRDLLYIAFHEEQEVIAAETITIKPGVHADFDRNGQLIGIELLEASSIVGHKIEFQLPELMVGNMGVPPLPVHS